MVPSTCEDCGGLRAISVKILTEPIWRLLCPECDKKRVLRAIENQMRKAAVGGWESA